MSMTSFGETLTREKTAAYGGFADAIGGLATVVLAIIGLAGVHQTLLVPIAIIVFGVALMIQGGAMLSEYAGITFPSGMNAPAMNQYAQDDAGSTCEKHARQICPNTPGSLSLPA